MDYEDSNGARQVIEASNLVVELNKEIDSIEANDCNFSKHYVAAPAVNEVVCAGPCYLKGIIVGADVAGSIIEVSDHASDGDGNVEIYKTGATLMTANGGFIKVNAYFATGICADITNQTHLTFIYE